MEKENNELNIKNILPNVKRGKVLLGMSGGVDSSVSAVLLKEAGFDVIGATMRLLPDDDPEISDGCCSLSSMFDAIKVCAKLGIPHYTLHCEEDFDKKVICDFMNSYRDGKTPNPCVECNRYFKFGAFYDKAMELGCDYIAMGHYAKIEYSEKYGQNVLRKSSSNNKDQTYFLYNIQNEVLQKMIFPLEDFETKDEVRAIAEKYNLTVAKRKDSQEICFCPDGNYQEFLLQQFKNRKLNKEDMGAKEGNFIFNGKTIGKHKGVMYYTVGQRKGLGISYKEPLYVIRIDKDRNEVVLGTNEDLFSKELKANELNFLLKNFDLSKKVDITAKIRYSTKDYKATLAVLDDNLKKDGCNNSISRDKIAIVKFDEPQRAITPGQSVVFYLDDGVVLGGGKII